MRRYGIENPYEKLKELTRGNTIDKLQHHSLSLTSSALDHSTTSTP
jgi:hypothetical protein